MAKIRTWYSDPSLESVLRSHQICPLAGECDPLFVFCAWDPSDFQRAEAAKDALLAHLPIPNRERISFVQTHVDDVNRCIDEMPKDSDKPRPAGLACSFCGRARVEVKLLVPGPPRVFICDACYADSNGVWGETMACSFCGQDRRGLRSRLSATSICEECLALVREIVEEAQSR